MVINHQVLDILKQLVKVSDMNEVKERVLSIIGTILEMNEKDIPDDAAPGVIEKWDSLRHMSLILALEQEFEIRFTDDEMTELLNFKLIVDIVSERLKND
jgi:acyl carrier protein